MKIAVRCCYSGVNRDDSTGLEFQVVGSQGPSTTASERRWPPVGMTEKAKKAGPVEPFGAKQAA